MGKEKGHDEAWRRQFVFDAVTIEFEQLHLRSAEALLYHVQRLDPRGAMRQRGILDSIVHGLECFLRYLRGAR